MRLGSNGQGLVYPSIAVDLRHIKWDFRSDHSTDGVAPKAMYQGRFYKLSSFNPDSGFYGDVAVTECVVSDVLDMMGIAHIHYSLLNGMIVYEGKEYVTPVCVSEHFNPERKPSLSLERHLRSCCPALTPLEGCLKVGLGDYVYTMFLVDFLILNRDRHGANIEIIDGIPVPLFDHGAALVALNDYHVWNHRVGDVVNNYVGSYSLTENLKRIPLERWPRVNLPDTSVV